jgi:UDP-glucose 4-epimerase
VINLGTGKSTTVLEMIKTFERVNKITIPYNILERRKGDLGICYANPEKAGRILNWIAKRSISEMCESSWADHLRRNGLI